MLGATSSPDVATRRPRYNSGDLITPRHEYHTGACPTCCAASKRRSMPPLTQVSHRSAKEHQLSTYELRTIQPGDKIAVGAFSVEPFRRTQLPDSVGYRIRTPSAQSSTQATQARPYARHGPSPRSRALPSSATRASSSSCRLEYARCRATRPPACFGEAITSSFNAEGAQKSSRPSRAIARVRPVMYAAEIAAAASSLRPQQMETSRWRAKRLLDFPRELTLPQRAEDVSRRECVVITTSQASRRRPAAHGERRPSDVQCSRDTVSVSFSVPALVAVYRTSPCLSRRARPLQPQPITSLRGHAAREELKILQRSSANYFVRCTASIAISSSLAGRSRWGQGRERLRPDRRRRARDRRGARGAARARPRRLRLRRWPRRR